MSTEEYQLYSNLRAWLLYEIRHCRDPDHKDALLKELARVEAEMTEEFGKQDR